MRIDRRTSGGPDRRQSCRTGQVMSPAAIEAIRRRETAAALRENAIAAREQAVLEREEAVLGREIAPAAEQGNLATSGELESINAKLRMANESLVVAALQSYAMTEEIEKTKATMTHLAHHDFLTDLPNRVQLYERIAQAIALARRHHVKLAVLFLDLDRFKNVNDTLGHAIGDQLLQSVAHRLKGVIRSTDTICRHGGDEFVLLLSEVGQAKALALKINEIHRVITLPYNVAGNTLTIGATIGVSIYPDDGEDADTLIRNADVAMYHAKENGRNKYQFFSQEMHARDMERQGVEASLCQALVQQQFVLYYQAQIRLEDGVISGAEALIRWRHPSRGLLQPAWFISVAEECGAIVPIGRWVLREACRQARLWLDAGLTFDIVTVNISATEFENDDFLKIVRNVLLETGLQADHLELDLSETVLMKSIETTTATLHALRSMGVRISIDDFGTGYSSLSYLKHFPVDTMKIDKSFVNDISSGADDILLNAVIAIGKSLHHQVVAEGVETARQLDFLREQHCTSAQGFYLNVPMQADEFAVFLAQGRMENFTRQ